MVFISAFVSLKCIITKDMYMYMYTCVYISMLCVMCVCVYIADYFKISWPYYG